MAKSYNEVAVATAKEEGNYAKKSFAQELYNNIEELSENILYEDLIYQDDIVVDVLYDYLEQNENETITNEELIRILEENNNYIIGIDSEDEEVKGKIEADIKLIVRTINDTYKANKFNIMWKQKEAANKKILATQLGGVSRAIDSVADGIVGANCVRPST